MATTDESTAAQSEYCLRWDTMYGKNAGTWMTCTGITPDDVLIMFISRDATTKVPTDRLSGASLSTGEISHSSSFTGVSCEVLWHDVSA